MGVDSQVSGDIPHFGQTLGWEPTSDMFKDKVVELVFEDTSSLDWCEFLKRPTCARRSMPQKIPGYKKVQTVPAPC